MPKPKTRANGTGTAFKRGKTWTCEVVVGYKADENGTMRPVRRTKGGFRTKTEALNYAQELKSAGLSRKQGQTVTLDMLWQAFEKSTLPKKSKSKQTHYRVARKKIESIAYVDIRLLTIDDLQSLVERVAPTYYPAKDIKTLLTQLYKRAVAEQTVTTNLADFIVLPTLNETESIPFSEQEVIALWKYWQETSDVTCGCVLLMIYTGMMPGELFNLEKSMVDFDEQTIVGAGIKTKTRKTKPIVLPDIILPVLRSLCEQAPGEKLAQACRFTFYPRFRDLIETLGLNQNLHPYSCRHTTATTLGKTNTPLFAIKDILRHAKITTTQRYVHLDATPLIDAANNVYPKTSTKGSDKPSTNDVE